MRARAGAVFRMIPVVATMVVAAACGGPSHEYISNNADGVYFRIPPSWSTFAPAEIDKAQSGWKGDEFVGAILESTTWQTAIDADATPSIEHVFANKPADQPTVYAYVRTLYKQELSGASTESLKDIYLPLSDLDINEDVRILSEDQSQQGDAQGLRLRYTYKANADSPEQTVAQLSYLAPDTTKVYLLAVRCTSACFKAHAAEIDDILSSYTIKEVGRP